MVGRYRDNVLDVGPNRTIIEQTPSCSQYKFTDKFNNDVHIKQYVKQHGHQTSDIKYILYIFFNMFKYWYTDIRITWILFHSWCYISENPLILTIQEFSCTV